MSLAALKRHLRKSTAHSEEDIELLICHLKGSNKMVIAKVGDDDEMILCQLSKKEITVKQKAIFALEV